MAKKIGFIGAGNMAEALIKGIIDTGLYSKDDITASELWEPRRKYMADKWGIEVHADNVKVVKEAKFLVLAVKPQQIKEVFASTEGHLTKDHLIMSIAAGITLAELESNEPASRFIRVMPNQPCMVLAGASAFSRGSYATPEDCAAVDRVLKAVGTSDEVKEELLDTVTGLSGSGPAYGYMIIEALSDGGVLMGLPRDIALKLAAQTMLGAAKTILETGEQPARMKDIVCSPGGTTIEAVKVLEECGLRSALIAAVEAATLRSKELGKNK
ncbi:MAG: pyrroline-5-carboxylate reductase [Methanomassiliicoccaceae archaeon]|jgi:pyrroline-5-carboxylate reductase|nr:pyrroline-5-carboxylate reductase [Methanomassiliicoccaceae archaeon]